VKWLHVRVVRGSQKVIIIILFFKTLCRSSQMWRGNASGRVCLSVLFGL